MAIASRHKPQEKKFFGFCPIWQTGETNSSSNNNNHTSSASSTQNLHNSSAYHNRSYGNNSRADGDHPGQSSSTSVSSVARSLLPARRRLRLDPSNKLYFPRPIRHHHCPIPYDEPGKQARSAIRLKNTSKSHVAFKFQTTAPKSCYMRPPGGILAPGESIIATVFKFVEHPDNNEKQSDQKTRVKFKIMSLKVKGGTDYVPELFDEQKEQVTMERILRVVFLDMERPSPAMEKLKRHLAEAEAAVEARKKPPAAEIGPPVVGDGLVIDEWKERREKYLARQQVEAVGSG